MIRSLFEVRIWATRWRVEAWSLLASATLIACGEGQHSSNPATAGMGTLTSSESVASAGPTSGTASNAAATLDTTSLVTSSSSNGTQTTTASNGTNSASATSGATTGLGTSGASTSGASTNATSSGGAGGGGTDATISSTTTAAGGSGGTGSTTGPTLPPITDYSDAGPFTTTRDEGVGPNGGYTVIRPEPLGEDGFLHAPIVFGPGIGQQWSVHTEMLTNFASHGFVVVACPVLSGGPGDEGNRMTMLSGLDWILEQNGEGGTYQGKIYVDRAISMGFSVGGTAAVEVGSHAAVATVVSIHGHTAAAELHGPMLQTTGTEDGLGRDLQQETYDMSEVQTFLATLTGAPHGYIESNGGGEQRPAIVAWMRYWIYDDAGASHYFFGDDCVLCTAPWENPQRKYWPE